MFGVFGTAGIAVNVAVNVISSVISYDDVGVAGDQLKLD